MANSMVKARIKTCIASAKTFLAEGEHALRQVAEFIGEAVELGAKSKDIAQQLEKSESYISALLKWVRNDFREPTPFGAQSKAKRERAKVQAPKASDVRKRANDTASEELSEGDDDFRIIVEAWDRSELPVLLTRAPQAVRIRFSKKCIEPLL